jgi:hypothetical protein
MVDHVVDNVFDDLDSIESVESSEPGSTGSGEDQGTSQSTVSVQDVSSGEELSPWPKLNKCFSVCHKRNNNLSFKCLLCKPRKTVLSTYITSHSNLRKHIKVFFQRINSYQYFNSYSITNSHKV